MDSLKRKVQVVVARRSRDDWEVLSLKTNKKRGGFWQNITGSVDKGEDFLDAAIRETNEESAYRVQNKKEIKELFEFEYFSPKFNKQCIEKVYLIITTHNWEVKLDANEHVEYQWRSLKSFSQDLYEHESNFKAIKKTQEHINEYCS